MAKILFEKGKSGNPGGRPKADHRLSDLAREYTDLALKTLVSIASDYEAPPAARVKASEVLLDRGYGRPHQSIEHSGEILHTTNTTEDIAVLTRYGVKLDQKETVQ